MKPSLPSPKRRRAVLFDLMGTCADWHSALIPKLLALPPLPTASTTAQGNDAYRAKVSQLAIDWREGFFKEIHTRFQAGLPQEDIDETHRRVLDRILEEEDPDGIWDEEERSWLVQGWHDQRAWPDAVQGIQQLKRDRIVCVLANGTTKLQLDIVKSAGFEFDMLFSSQLLELTKPDPRIYKKALKLIDVNAEDTWMVAAHAYDLRAAKAVGMKTAYIYRTTEDTHEDLDQLRQEFDLFLDGDTNALGADVGIEDVGLQKLVRLLEEIDE